MSGTAERVGGGEPRIDLSKSLRHLSLHGFDVSGATQAVASPLRHHSCCWTPAGTPGNTRPSRIGDVDGSSETMNDGVPRSKPWEVGETSFSTQEESSSSSVNPWNEESCTLSEHMTPTKASHYREISTGATNYSSFNSQDDTLPIKVSPSAPKRTLRSTIDANESEAIEVTLDLLSFDKEAIASKFRRVKDLPNAHESPVATVTFPTNTHIHHPVTPQTPVRLNFCGMPSWCDTNSSSLLLGDSAQRCSHVCAMPEGWCATGGGCYDEAAQQALRNEICAALGLDGWSWQALYARNAAASPVEVIPPIECHGMATQPRRVINMRARRARLASVRRDLYPFDASSLSSQSHSYPIGKSQSFNGAPPITSLKKRPSGAMASWECGRFGVASREASPVVLGAAEHGGYDSEPEVSPDKENRADRHRLQQSSCNVQEFLNERFTFIQHSAGSKSIAVHAWIELGQQLRDRLILPKLCWKPIHGPPDQLSSLELLDICRIRPGPALDRSTHPFAVQRRLVALQSASSRGTDGGGGGGEAPVVFEARSVADRDRWMHLCKLTISTLAAKFLTRDPAVLPLFFAECTIRPPPMTPGSAAPLCAWV